MPHVEGFAKGFTSVNYPGVDGIPLLNSFYFRFEKNGSSSPIDNHINSIRVLPAGDSIDLSPGADLGPSVVTPGKLDLTYADKDPTSSKDRYFFKITHSNLALKHARRFQFRDLGCTGKCEQVLPKPPGPILPGFEPVFVLCGFKVFFTGNRDHHLDGLSVFENNGKLTVEFNDKNDDDVFGYLVDYALVSRVGMNIQLGEESGTAKGGARVLLPGDKVIRGFRFDLRSSDHHLREVGVITGKDRIEVYDSDVAADDTFDWFVRWATISEMVLEQ